MADLVNTDLGTTGKLKVSESAGVLTIEVTEVLQSGITADIKVSASTSVLLTAWAGVTTNASLKAILTEAATLLANLPA